MYHGLSVIARGPVHRRIEPTAEFDYQGWTDGKTYYLLLLLLLLLKLIISVTLHTVTLTIAVARIRLQKHAAFDDSGMRFACDDTRFDANGTRFNRNAGVISIQFLWMKLMQLALSSPVVVI